MADATAAARLRTAATDAAARLTDEMVALLCEADVRPCMGLGTGHALRVQQRLAREWQRPRGRLDKPSPVDRALAQGDVGTALLPQVHALRETLNPHAVAGL